MKSFFRKVIPVGISAIFICAVCQIVYSIKNYDTMLTALTLEMMLTLEVVFFAVPIIALTAVYIIIRKSDKQGGCNMSSEKASNIVLVILTILSVVFFSWLGLVIGDLEILSYLEFGMLCTITIIAVISRMRKNKD